MRRFLLLCIFQLGVLQAQDYFPTNTAVKTKELNYQAFTNATIHLNPSKKRPLAMVIMVC